MPKTRNKTKSARVSEIRDRLSTTELPLSLRFRDGTVRFGELFTRTRERSPAGEGEPVLNDFQGRGCDLLMGDRVITQAILKRTPDGPSLSLESPEGEMSQEALLDLLMDTPLTVVAELGRVTCTMADISRLEGGDWLPLDQGAEDPASLYIKRPRMFVGRGRVVVVGKRFGLRMLEGFKYPERKLEASDPRPEPYLEGRCVLGRAVRNPSEIAALEEGDIVQLDSDPWEPVELNFSNGLILRGQLSAVDPNFGFGFRVIHQHPGTNQTSTPDPDIKASPPEETMDPEETFPLPAVDEDSGNIEGSLPFGFLSDIDSGRAARLLDAEHPRTAALALSYMDPDTASRILSRTAEERRPDILRRIARMGTVRPEIRLLVERTVKNRLQALDFPGAGGGLDLAVSLVSRLSWKDRRVLLKKLLKTDAELARELGKTRRGP